MNEPVEVTYQYLDRHKTKKGAWTKKQILALGLTWPLETGWKERIVGTQIPGESARIFETENVPKTKENQNKKRKLTIDECIAYLFKNALKLTPHQIVRLRNVESKWKDFR